jgi:hypothetical protein
MISNSKSPIPSRALAFSEKRERALLSLFTSSLHLAYQQSSRVSVSPTPESRLPALTCPAPRGAADRPPTTETLEQAGMHSPVPLLLLLLLCTAAAASDGSQPQVRHASRQRLLFPYSRLAASTPLPQSIPAHVAPPRRRRRRHLARHGGGWCRWPPRRRSSAP